MYHGYLQHYGVYSPFRYMYYLLLIPWVRVLTHSWHCGSYICRFISLKLLPFPLLYFTALINSFSSYLISEPIFSGSILLSAVQSSSLSILLTPILILAFSAPQFRSISVSIPILYLPFRFLSIRLTSELVHSDSVHD